MRNLLAFPGKTTKLHLPHMIGVNYHAFGVFLLHDNFGTITKALENQYNKDAALINQAIFTEWLQGKGAQPVAWSTLIGALKDMKLCTLADEIDSIVQCK